MNFAILHKNKISVLFHSDESDHWLIDCTYFWRKSGKVINIVTIIRKDMSDYIRILKKHGYTGFQRTKHIDN